MSEIVDQAARDVAIHRVDHTVAVLAGAGSGKTSVLVDRVVELVKSGVPIREIAAVTFTDSAAAELRDRLRAALSEARPDQVADLDAAAIGTLHSFARRILDAHPIEAGLPPVIEVLDEVATSVRNQRWWSTVRTQLLEDDALAEAVRVLLDAGIQVNAWAPNAFALQTLALRMQEDWDLVADRLGSAPGIDIPPVDLQPVFGLVARLTSAVRQVSDPDDKLSIRIEEICRWAEGLEQHATVSVIIDWWASRPSCRVGRTGRSGNWPDIDRVRSLVAGLDDIDVVGPVLDACLRQVTNWLALQVLAGAEERRLEGQLIFHDLLVLARRVVRASPVVRSELQRRYPRILLDEFQDTDPIQVELAVRIAAGAEGGAPDWRSIRLPDGSLTVVGDPKQSIYRFRRADIATFMDAVEFLGPTAQVELTTNFRSHSDILDWINHVFGTLITDQGKVQPPFVPLDPSPTREHPKDRPRVMLLHEVDGGQDIEARYVADVIATALDERWPYLDRSVKPARERPLKASDIAILVPARTGVPELAAALSAVGVPYRLVAQSLIYGSDQVRDLLLVAAAADDPSNEFLLAAALRTPILRCGDDDLWRWRHAGGSWRIWADPPAGLPEDDPVAGAMRFLHEVAKQSDYRSPSELLMHIIKDRDLLALAAVDDDPREVWRRYRVVVDQARQWAETAHGSLRDYLAWASSRAEVEDRENQIVLDEHDADEVSVMTIHAAKGLQFGMVVFAGLVSAPKRSPGMLVWHEDGIEVSLGEKNATTLGWRSAKSAEANRLEAEDRRLLYVACTRAEDYLVVSGFGGDGQRGQILRSAATGAGHEEWSLRDSRVAWSKRLPDLTFEEDWDARHEVMARNSGQRQAVSAGAIAHGEAHVPDGLVLGDLPPGLDKAARDLEQPAWLKGRYGTQIGRAVHATLQSVDLATGDDLDGVATAQALVEGVVQQRDLVAALARAGFNAPVVRQAARCRFQRETFVGTQVGGEIVEGFIDLLFTDQDGQLVVVDYKTDAEPSREMLDAYARQLAVYAVALRDATGCEVSRRVLVFCRPEGAVEVEV